MPRLLVLIMRKRPRHRIAQDHNHPRIRQHRLHLPQRTRRRQIRRRRLDHMPLPPPHASPPGKPRPIPGHRSLRMLRKVSRLPSPRHQSTADASPCKRRAASSRPSAHQRSPSSANAETDSSPDATHPAANPSPESNGIFQARNAGCRFNRRRHTRSDSSSPTSASLISFAILDAAQSQMTNDQVSMTNLLALWSSGL